MSIEGNFIDGQVVPSQAQGRYETIDPTHGRVSGRFVEAGPEDIDRAVESARQAFRSRWAPMPAAERGKLLMRWGDLIADQAEEIGRAETRENGKLLAEMWTQALAVREWLYYFGGLADKVEGRVVPHSRPNLLNYTLREPLGVIGVITPWNSPTFLTIMSAAPALAAGNTIVVKPSEITPTSAFLLAKLAFEAGLPQGVVNVISGGRTAGEALVDHPDVAKIIFTGSEGAGRAIASRCGQRLIGATLELGGKSANIVFEDANLDRAEAGLLSGIFAAAGQTCVAGSRALVHRSIIDEMRERLSRRAAAIRVGDPLDERTEMGPVATAAQLDKDESMIRRAIDDGAELVYGGERASIAGFENGYFFKPTIVAPPKHSDFIMNEEVFGPVLSLYAFDDEDHAIEVANSTRFALASGIWTEKLSRAHRVAAQIQAGTVWINTYRSLAPSSPFGGINASGMGHQNGQDAIEQYLKTKSVWCELGDDIPDPFVIKTPVRAPFRQ